MSDNKTPSDLDLIASMNDLARQIGEMEPDDPLRAVRLKELYTLRERSKSFETERNKIMRYDNGCAPQRPETQSSRSRLSFMTLSVRIPLREYDDFVKALDASSRAAEILKNACYHKEMTDEQLEPFMEIACTEEELKILLNLANRYYPAAVPFISNRSNL